MNTIISLKLLMRDFRHSWSHVGGGVCCKRRDRASAAVIEKSVGVISSGLCGSEN